MDQTEYRSIFSARDRARCNEAWAVLDAVRIPAEVVHEDGIYHLMVHESDAARALRELEDYVREAVRPAPEPDWTPLSDGRIAAFVYAAVLVLVTAATGRHVFGADWFDAGRAQSGSIVSGQWWRAVTALTLHIDARHLLGNLLFGSVLGLLAAQGLGAGVAWLAIVVGGTLGNLANAFLRDPSHAAVGASTAVFAALGLLVGFALRRNRGRPGGAVRRWSPLVAGVLLLAWTGTSGERTDVLAHVSGLAAGVALGAVSGFVPTALLKKRSLQALASLTALALLGLAWGLALR